MNVLQKNILGQDIPKDYDNKILLQKGLYGMADETVAASLSMSLPEYKRAVEELVYRHITCNFSSKDLLKKSLSLSDSEIDDICKRIHNEVNAPVNINFEIQTLKAQVRRMEHRMFELEDRLYEYEHDRHPPRTPRHRERYNSDSRTQRSRRYDYDSEHYKTSRKNYDDSRWRS